MPFEKGNKLGGRRRKEKFVYAALLMELKAAGEDLPCLREVMKVLIAQAKEGQPWAIRELIDRIDGKAMQAVEIDSHEDRTINVTVAEQAGRISALLGKLGPVLEGELASGTGDDELEPRKVKLKSVRGNGGNTGGSSTRH